MTTRTISLDLPEDLYARAKRAAERLRRPIDEVLLKAVDTALPSEAELPPELTPALDALLFLRMSAPIPDPLRRRVAGPPDTPER